MNTVYEVVIEAISKERKTIRMNVQCQKAGTEESSCKERPRT